MESLINNRTPSANIVVSHYIYGTLAFLLACTMLTFSSAGHISGHFFNPLLLGITHIVVLGWITMIIFGALYQLIPVIMETQLYSQRLARITFCMLGCGVPVLAYAFLEFKAGSWLQTGAILVCLSVILFSFNIFMSFPRNYARKTEDEFISYATGWLLLTALFGTLLVFNLTYPLLSVPHTRFLKLHAHLGFIGWFLLLVTGVSYKLIPMFLVSINRKPRLMSIVFYLINGGLLLMMISWGLNLSAALLMTGGILVILAIALYTGFLWNTYKKAARKKPDIGMKFTGIAFIFLLTPIVTGLYIFIANAGVSTGSLYGFMVIFGFFSALVMGMTYKTLPFIIWLKKFRHKAGKENIPLPKDLYNNTLAHIQLLSYSSGFPAFIAGFLGKWDVLVKTGSILLMITAMLFVFNVFKIIFGKTYLSAKPSGYDTATARKRTAGI